MYKLLLLAALLSLGIFSCKENDHSSAPKTASTPSVSNKGIHLAPMPYYSLLNELEFDEIALRALDVKEYKASYYLIETDTEPYKIVYNALQPKVGDLSFYMIQKMQGKKDTLVKQTLKTLSGNTEQSIRRVHTPSGGYHDFDLMQTFDAEKRVLSKTQINRSNQRKTIELLRYKNGQLTNKELVGLGEESYTPLQNQTTLYVLRKTNGDTVRSSTRTTSENTLVEQFVKGGKDRFEYHYDQNQLQKVLWTDGNKTMAEFTFKYNDKGLLISRLTKSSIPAFPSNLTRYEFK